MENVTVGEGIDSLFGYTVLVYATMSIAVLSFTVWLHHFFTMGSGASVNSFFGITTMIISIPTGAKIFNWLFTMYRGRVRYELPMMWLVAFMLTFVIGGMTGVLLAVPPADFVLHNSLFLIAHFQKAALLMFSDRLVEALKRLDVNDAASIKRFKRAIRASFEGFLRFTHRYWFHEISEQAHVRALSRLCATHLGLDALYAEVKERIEDMGGYLDADSLRRQANTVVRLTVVTILGLDMAGLLAGGLGLIGFPATAGFASQWTLLQQVAVRDARWIFVMVPAALLVAIGYLRGLAVLGGATANSQVRREPVVAGWLIALAVLASALLGLAPQLLTGPVSAALAALATLVGR